MSEKCSAAEYRPVAVISLRVDIENTRSIQHVMKNGRLYDGDTLDEVWPRQPELPPLWLADDRPGASPAR